MSDYGTIRRVSEALRSLLVAGITDSTDGELAGVSIELDSPKRMRADNRFGVSLWLYRVVRDGDGQNLPPERVGTSLVRAQPLALDLFYLVTPLTADPKDDQLLLGRALQLLHGHGVARPGEIEIDDELHITLEPLSLEELTRVWHALQEPYSLSVSYRAQVVSIDLDRRPDPASRVLDSELGYVQVLESR